MIECERRNHATGDERVRRQSEILRHLREVLHWIRKRWRRVCDGGWRGPNPPVRFHLPEGDRVGVSRQIWEDSREADPSEGNALAVAAGGHAHGTAGR